MVDVKLVKQADLKNLTQDLLEKSELAEHAYEEKHKICWKEAKVLQIEQTPHRANTRNPPTCLQ
jgi:hypothetical protein